jgi:hypothetical protein
MKRVNEDLVKRVHAKIVRFGKRVNPYHHFLGGLYAHNSGDGFIMAVSDAYNYVKISFGDQLKYECVNDESHNHFLRKVRKLDSSYR